MKYKVFSHESLLSNIKNKKDYKFLSSFSFNDINSINSNTLNYEFDNYKNIEKKEIFLDNFYEENKIKIFKKLNQIINSEIQYKSWEIILGSVLRKLINVVYDRYQILSQNKRIIKCLYLLKTDKKSYEILDEDELTTKFQKIDWNNRLFYSIAKYLDIKTITKSKRRKKKIKNKKKTIKSLIKSIFYNSLILASKKRIINSKSIFTDPYIENRLNKSFFLKSKISKIYDYQYQFLYYDKLKLIKKFNINNRKPFFKKKQKKSFENFFFENINYLIPLAYLENFNKLKEKSQNLILPVNPKKILTSLSPFKNELFKFWLAFKEKKFKLYIFQHGGEVGQRKCNNDYIKHSVAISDKFFSWGFQRSDLPKIKKFYSNVFSNENLITDNKKKKYDILIVLPPVRRYMSQITTGVVMPGFMTYEFINRIKSMINFFEKKRNLLFPYKNLNIAVKIHPDTSENGSNPGYNLETLFKKNHFDIYSDQKSFKELVSDSRLVLHTYEGTPFFETCKLKINSIMLLSDFHNQMIYGKYKNIYNSLVKDSIIINTFSLYKIDDIINNDVQLYSKKSAFKYLEKFCKTTNNYEDKLETLLND